MEYTGADPGFQVRGGGAHLKKLRREEGGANIFGVFRVPPGSPLVYISQFVVPIMISLIEG